MSDQPITILCLASYHKGDSFMRAAKELGCRVLLVTREKLRDEDWPRDSIDEMFFMPQLSKRPDIIYAVAYLMRSESIDRIVPLDDYDVETAATLREHFRLPGIGETVVRHFRDKLGMRVKARAEGFLVPEFTPVFNYDKLRAWMDRVQPPWVLKPRSEAGAMGIKKVHSQDEVWHWLNELGDEQSFFHLEQFVTGEIYHVDSAVWDGEVVYAIPHKYLRTPMSVAHEGGVFVTRTLPRDGEEGAAILDFNQRLLPALGMEWGVSHTEFICGEDGRYYFLETAARVGGANTEDLIEAGGGANLWGERAKMEVASVRGEPYDIPQDTGRYAGTIICLARQEWPDLSGYQDSEIVYRVHKKHHAGLIVASNSHERVEELIRAYSDRFSIDFLAVAPPLDTAPQ